MQDAASAVAEARFFAYDVITATHDLHVSWPGYAGT